MDTTGALDRAERLLARLAGPWRLERRIEDRRAGETGRFVGTGGFVAEDTDSAARGGTRLVYSEVGALVLADRPAVRAERRYLWRAAQGHVAVDFADGRPFHGFDPAETEPTAQHLCGSDRYQVTYRFDQPDGWRAVWQVSGPRKDYVMHARYWRA